jgi:hypothetical protein
LNETRTFDLPGGAEVQSAWPGGEVPQSGRMTAVTAWRDGWVAMIESCITEIGLSLETRLWIAVDADNDKPTFRVDADGPERSWQRNLHLTAAWTRHPAGLMPERSIQWEVRGGDHPEAGGCRSSHREPYWLMMWEAT